MELRPLKEAEQKYTYTQSMQLAGQTGCIGHLRGDFGRDGYGFYTSWEDHQGQWKTDEFKAELDNMVNALRSEEYGLLKDRSAMRRYAAGYPESGFMGNYCAEYGFRAETEKHAFLIRCNPTQGDYNFYCYCYVKEWLDRHIQNAEQGIQFVNSRYQELFRIADGEKITVIYPDGEKRERVCRYIDEAHMETSTAAGRSIYHICQFAEIMKRCGASYVPAKSLQQEETRGILELRTRFGMKEKIKLEVSSYADNKSLYVGMTALTYGEPEPYGAATVNLQGTPPPYCAFVDTNNIPELEEFLTKNRIAEFTGLKQRSGFGSYPLYMFNGEKLRKLCPEGMASYEQENGLQRMPKKKEKSR